MVGGLVEQEQIGPGEQLAGQLDPAALAAAQGYERARPRGVGIEAQPVQHRVHPRCDRVAAFTLELLQVAIVARQHPRRAVVARCRHRGGLLRQ